MKFSKIAVAVLFAAGLIGAPASAGFATSCAEGYQAIDREDGTSACEVEAVPFDVEEIKPIDSCWTTEEGIDVCARGGIAPVPATGEEVTPETCSVSTDEEGNELTACYDTVPYETPLEDGEGMGNIEDRTKDIDETLMYQTGVAMPMAGSDSTASNTLAFFGVLVAALGALGIGISRERSLK